MKHGELWLFLMLIAVAVSFIIPYPMGTIQASICGFSAGVKVARIWL